MKRQYSVPQMATRENRVRAMLLAGSMQTSDYGVCPVYGKRGGNHKGWCGYHKRNF